jgi:hypothetical protein
VPCIASRHMFTGASQSTPLPSCTNGWRRIACHLHQIWTGLSSSSLRSSPSPATDGWRERKPYESAVDMWRNLQYTVNILLALVILVSFILSHFILNTLRAHIYCRECKYKSVKSMYGQKYTGNRDKKGRKSSDRNMDNLCTG